MKRYGVLVTAVAIVVILGFKLYIENSTQSPPIDVQVITSPSPVNPSTSSASDSSQDNINPSDEAKSCQIDADCPGDQSCIQSGPIVLDPVTKKPLSYKTCQPKGSFTPH